MDPANDPTGDPDEPLPVLLPDGTLALALPPGYEPPTPDAQDEPLTLTLNLEAVQVSEQHRVRVRVWSVAHLIACLAFVGERYLIFLVPVYVAIVAWGVIGTFSVPETLALCVMLAAQLCFTLAMLIRDYRHTYTVVSFTAFCLLTHALRYSRSLVR